MGIIYEAHCPSCGYASGSLFVGPGMAKAHISYDLARCEHCREIVLVRSSSVRPRCPKCRHKVQAVHIPRVMARGGGSERIECPKCGNLTLAVALVGLWD